MLCQASGSLTLRFSCLNIGYCANDKVSIDGIRSYLSRKVAGRVSDCDRAEAGSSRRYTFHSASAKSRSLATLGITVGGGRCGRGKMANRVSAEAERTGSLKRERTAPTPASFPFPALSFRRVRPFVDLPHSAT